ncbi:MAG: HAMP domain-containing protein [Bacteroidales bacterium]|nr:HAMP domain-containing protein [Bacteroidales bacterium]
MRISISFKLLIYFFFFSFLGIVSIGTYSYQKARKAMISRTFNQLNSVRIEKENRLKVFFGEILQDMEKLSEFEETIRVFNSENPMTVQQQNEFHHFIDAFFHSNSGYECLTFYDGISPTLTYPINRKINIDTISCKTTDYTYQGIFQKALKEKIWVHDHFISLEDNQPKILISKVFRFGDKPILMILRIPVDFINEIMIDNNPMNGLGESGESYLVGSDGLMRSSSRFKENSVLSIEVDTKGVSEAFRGKTGTGIFDDYRKVRVLSSYSKVKLPYLNWAILAEIDFREAMIPINQIRNNIVYLTLIITLLTLGIVAILSVALTQPIKALKKETEKIALGEYGKPIEMVRHDELGDLIKAFNEMSRQLKDQSETLELERKLRLTSMIDGQELERQRLSRELHDSLGQQLLAIKMQLENALDSEWPQSKEIINSAIESFTLTTREIRNLSNNLMPAVLTEFGLITALKNLVRNFRVNFQTEIRIESEIEDKFLNVRQETYLYRICQEALNNLAKYANADEACIILKVTKPNLLTLTIKDSGIGFSMDQEHLSKGNGLTTMKERAILLGGKFKLKSSNGSGTEIFVQIPINHNNTHND